MRAPVSAPHSPDSLIRYVARCVIVVLVVGQANTLTGPSISDVLANSLNQIAWLYETIECAARPPAMI
jgi:hypothetical protein